MRNVILLSTLALLVGCTSMSATSPAGSVSSSHQFDMTDAYRAYYNAVKLQAAPVEVVHVGLDSEGRVNSFQVFQAPDRFEIPAPQKSYSPGWKSLDAFTEGMWGAVRFAVPGAATWAVADSINRYNSKNVASNPGNTSDSYNTRGDTPTDSFNDFSNQGNPINNSNQGNPIDSSDHGDYRTNYGNAVSEQPWE